MCGIAGIVGAGWTRAQLEAMVASQAHRGPDASGTYVDPADVAGLGHNRLSIIDLSEGGRQPMSIGGGRWIVFNGEIYNYLELRRELAAHHHFRSGSDTEVLLAAYDRWGERCLDRLVGMFAFALWDERHRSLFAARDRFGVKPLNYHLRGDGTLFLASEVRALHAAGVPAAADTTGWATYLAHGVSDTGGRTFWEGIHSLPAGHSLTWRDGHVHLARWYDLAERVGPELDTRPADVVGEEYAALLRETIRLRFRADVPVGINLSGGVDSSALLGLVHAVQGADSEVQAFTFVTGDEAYDELPWVRSMLARTQHPLHVCPLSPGDVPALAAAVQAHQDAPFGGLPTLAYARLFEHARAEGVIVLLDGQGMDEQWAGYDYYRTVRDGGQPRLLQGARDPSVRPDCLEPGFAACAVPFEPPRPLPDALRNLQYRDARYTKMPRALRFNDRVSMRASTELREPFLDHRLFELALRQPAERKIRDGTGKWMLRRIVRELIPEGVVNAPKRPLQTPQREWLRGPLRAWADGRIEAALAAYGGTWLDVAAVRQAWGEYGAGHGDNSFWVWQWINLGLAVESPPTGPAIDAGHAPALHHTGPDAPVGVR
jgi:asparagine synthase (glutamine-hydrolysing)